MGDNIIKPGGISLIIGKNHYKDFLPEKKNKVLKISRKINTHNELKYLDKIKSIKDYEKYYVIPDNDILIINPGNKFYQHIQKIAIKERLNHLYGSLICFYMDFGGEMDVHDSVKQILDYNTSKIWINYDSIISFSKIMIEALYFLHDKKICHLDIKPENIIIKFGVCINFRIIDFGFSSIEPFDDYISNTRGTPGYFPKQIHIEDDKMPQIKANDVIVVDGSIPMMKNRSLVYKVDSFCLGRVLQFITNYFLEYYTPGCFDCVSSKKIKLNNIIKSLLESDVYKRKSIIQMKHSYFH